jgi:hypothetical protein
MRSSRRSVLRAAVGLVVLTLGLRLEASVVVPATLDELAAEADVVVYARVAGVDTRQAPGTLRVERIVALDVVRALKGTPPEGLRIVLPGGTFGRYRTIVPGIPEVIEGDEGVFFLRASGVTLPGLVGFSQGFLRVRVDPSTGTRTVSAPVVADAEGPIVRGATDRGPQPLARVESRIATVVLAQARGRR